jgi:hypothetical protein
MAEQYTQPHSKQFKKAGDLTEKSTGEKLETHALYMFDYNHQFYGEIKYNLANCFITRQI